MFFCLCANPLHYTAIFGKNLYANVQVAMLFYILYIFFVWTDGFKYIDIFSLDVGFEVELLLLIICGEEIDVLNSIDDSSVDVVYIKSDDELIFISLDELFLDTQDALNRSNPIVTINVVTLNFISYSRPFFVGL